MTSENLKGRNLVSKMFNCRWFPSSVGLAEPNDQNYEVYIAMKVKRDS